jgi:hypothetical protein
VCTRSVWERQVASGTMATCACFCCDNSAQDVRGPLVAPVWLVGHSLLDDANVVLRVDTSHAGCVHTSRGHFGSLLQACTGMGIDGASLVVRDAHLGPVHLASLRRVTWPHASESGLPSGVSGVPRSMGGADQSALGVAPVPVTAGWQCTNAQVPMDPATVALVLPAFGELLRTEATQGPPKRMRTSSAGDASRLRDPGPCLGHDPAEFDLQRTPACMWTAAALLASILRPRGDRGARSPVDLPVLLEVTDEHDHTFKRSIDCVWQHPHGGRVTLRMPQTIVYADESYLRAWRSFKATQQAADDDWDTWQ